MKCTATMLTLAGLALAGCADLRAKDVVHPEVSGQDASLAKIALAVELAVEKLADVKVTGIDSSDKNKTDQDVSAGRDVTNIVTSINTKGAGAVGGSLLIVVLGFLLRAFVRGRKALRIAIQAIETLPEPAGPHLKQIVAKAAYDQGVSDWLHRRVQHDTKRLLKAKKPVVKRPLHGVN
jgi:hypothetical protein